MRNLNELVQNIKLLLGARLVSVFVYGAMSTQPPEKMTKNVDSIFVVENLEGIDLKVVQPYVNKWIKKGNPVPVFFDKEEWYASSDVYAIEYADIKDFSNILYGEDVISNVNVERHNLRFQCELELKNLLVKFRQYYVQYADKPKELAEVVSPVIKSCIALFKTILRLHCAEIPSEKSEIIEKIADICPINKELFLELLCVKEKRCKLSAKDMDYKANELIKSLTELLKHVDKI